MIIFHLCTFVKNKTLFYKKNQEEFNNLCPPNPGQKGGGPTTCPHLNALIVKKWWWVPFPETPPPGSATALSVTHTCTHPGCRLPV